MSLKVTYDAVPGGYMWIARGFGLDAKNTAWLVKNEDIKWAKIPIGRIYGLKITAGISATKFGPYLITTRQEMATFIMSFIEAVNK